MQVIRIKVSTPVRRRARMLGRTIFDGMMQGVDEDHGNLLHQQYDDESDAATDVDPLCVLQGDRFDVAERCGDYDSLIPPGAVQPTISADNSVE